MSSTSDYAVYLGAWINWSHGPILGSTLTLTRRDGDLAIAFTAFFLAFVAARFWRMLGFVLHRVYSASEPQDVIYHQRQAILRNAATAEEALRLFLMLVWRNRRSRTWFRLGLTMLASLLCVATFAVAGGFSARISDSNGAEVLIASQNCGYLFGGSSSVVDEPFRAEKLQNAANYAQQCYSTSDNGPDCGRFVAGRLRGGVVDENAACPFSDEICRSTDGNIRLDTGLIDSHDDLGLNAPPSERISCRRVFSCAPLVTEGYTSQENTSIGPMTRYHYGTTAGVGGLKDYVHKAQNLEMLYAKDDMIALARHHLVNAMTSPVKKGVPYDDIANFYPIEPLSRTDGDVDLIFLSGNGMIYIEPWNDTWYRIDPTEWDVEMIEDLRVFEEQYYRPLEPASPMGCVDQYQFCGNGGCGPLASLRDAIAGAAHLFDTNYDDLASNRAQGPNPSRYMHFIHRFFSAYGNTRLLVSSLGPASLQSQRSAMEGLQGHLLPNQWKVDVTHLWNITLARLQSSMIDTAYGPTDPAILELWYNYTTPELQKICNSQKIRSTAYASLNVFGLCFTYALGSLIVVVSYLLEPLSSIFRRRNMYAHLEWATNAMLQLQRLAHEELGLGTWSHGAHEVPATESGELLGYLDITDPERPVLRAAGAGPSEKSPSTHSAENQTLSGDTAENNPSENMERTERTTALRQVATY